MKNLVCPVSPDKVYDAIPRLIAFQVITLLLVFTLIPNIYAPIFLVLDFLTRSVNKTSYSLLAIIAETFSIVTNVKGTKINKAPKVFAARLGLVFSLLILIFYVLGLANVSLGLVFLLGFCAALEMLVNFCVGCYIYTYIVLPLYKD